jgi:hypothetical protein
MNVGACAGDEVVGGRCLYGWGAGVCGCECWVQHGCRGKGEARQEHQAAGLGTAAPIYTGTSLETANTQE